MDDVFAGSPAFSNSLDGSLAGRYFGLQKGRRDKRIIS